MSNARRGLVSGAALVGVAGVGIGGFLLGAPEHEATSLVIDDDAGILHAPTVESALTDVRFHEPTDVAIFTHRGGVEATTDDYALNEAVLAHARADRPEWLSDDEQKWADDLYIFGVDPEGRLVGTYFGENRKVSQDRQLDIQDATKDDLRQGQWTEGAVVGVEEAAARMNAPFLRTVPGMLLAGVGVVGTAIGGAAWWGTGANRARRSRELRSEGDRLMASVIADVDVTELHARLIPEESRYGGLVLRRFDEYTQGVRTLTELGNEVRGIPEDDYNTKAALGRLTAYRDQARSMDHLDDVIADTAAFLGRDRLWREAWERQESPVRADLEGVDPMLGDDVPAEGRGLAQAQRLREYATSGLALLDQLRAQLEQEEVSPDDALDELKRTRDGLSDRLDALASAVAEEIGRTKDERIAMKKAMREERSRRRPEVTILTTTHPSWTWYPVDSFRSGLTAGASALTESRAGSSGGSASGYSSSGGSFSGAGSSSRF
ncbi:DUF5129 domain-containing protein [Serinicoccus kebangsaanensis]|uniref:DUF5129 domain-containing protein n=1 Tax=Serinicoccus kebangsaanensis TaxID=2602069 RepID=UPI00124CDDAE|nr:DUF5129 domain-containing protein [Serinicoccus kebangsaanensis]